MRLAYLDGVIEIVDDANDAAGRRLAGAPGGVGSAADAAAGRRDLVGDGSLPAEAGDGRGAAALPAAEAPAAPQASPARASAPARAARRVPRRRALLPVARRLKSKARG